MPETWCVIEGYDGETDRWRPLFLQPERFRLEMEAQVGVLLDASDAQLDHYGGYIAECEDFRLNERVYTTPEERARARRRRERAEAEAQKGAKRPLKAKRARDRDRRPNSAKPRRKRLA